MDDIDVAFHGGFGQSDAARDEATEQSFVCQLLAEARLTPAQVRQRARNDGEDAPSLQWFARNYPNFPVRLATCRIPHLAQLAAATLFVKDFLKHPVMSALTTAAEAADVDVTEERFGILFRWPGVGPMILHVLPESSYFHLAAPTASHDDLGQARLVRVTAVKRERVCLVLERLALFLASLRKDSNDMAEWCRQ